MCTETETISVLIVISYVATRFQSPIAVVSPARLLWRYPDAARRPARRGGGVEEGGVLLAVRGKLRTCFLCALAMAPRHATLQMAGDAAHSRGVGIDS